MWLPKQRDLTLNVPTKTPNPTAKNSMHTQTKANDMQGERQQLQVWRAKAPQNSPIVAATSTQNEQHTTWRWVRKISTPMESDNTKEMLTNGKIQPSLIMQIKIRHLQALLFGIKSLTQPYKIPTPLTLSLLYN